MAWSRRQLGSVVKKSEDKERFPKRIDPKTAEVLDPGVREFSIKITEDCSFKAGEYINLENKAFKLASLNANRQKMSEEVYNKSLERIHKMPDWCFFEIIKVKNEG